MKNCTDCKYFEDLLLQFLQSSVRNQWLTTSKFRVYVRKGKHLISGELQDCLDLANVEVYHAFRRQGIFKDLLLVCQQNNPFPILYIENVINDELCEHLRSYSKMLEFFNGASCFYMVQK